MLRIKIDMLASPFEIYHAWIRIPYINRRKQLEIAKAMHAGANEATFPGI